MLQEQSMHYLIECKAKLPFPFTKNNGANDTQIELKSHCGLVASGPITQVLKF